MRSKKLGLHEEKELLGFKPSKNKNNSEWVEESFGIEPGPFLSKPKSSIKTNKKDKNEKPNS